MQLESVVDLVELPLEDLYLVALVLVAAFFLPDFLFEHFHELVELVTFIVELVL